MINVLIFIWFASMLFILFDSCYNSNEAHQENIQYNKEDN